jgi:hypothetical protein
MQVKQFRLFSIASFIIFGPVVLYPTGKCFIARHSPMLSAVTTYHSCVLKPKSHRTGLWCFANCNYINFPIIWNIHPKILCFSRISPFTVLRAFGISRHGDGVKLNTCSIVCYSPCFALNAHKVTLLMYKEPEIAVFFRNIIGKVVAQVIGPGQ